MTRSGLLAVPALAALACSPRLLPGTDIHATRENRAVYEVVQQYKQAMERRDAQGVLALVAPDYYDNAGTPDPSDDLDRARLEQALTQDLARAESIRLDLTIRKVDIKADHAEVELFYDEYYLVKTGGGSVPRRDSDIHRLKLRKIQGSWKITSGL